ncbi:uncharacterized protein Aud_003637 [Aspergillus udagawae]|uniref:Uncharacterized protein n=1 Tax=Aspergillus udagawae TaxID=91492 RepID=A0A8E0V062_9EURO|nr:uncharacterized protein Aud_003637 [Aspergillus udagawae]GIC87254.1 hypothetical protein Aud_003637 [Aspergillus udagawae]
MGAIPVASRIQSVQSAAANARREHRRIQPDASDGKDGDVVVAAYDQLHPETLSALNVAEQEHFGAAKVPAESYRMAAPSVAELDAAFDKTNMALAA